MQLRQVFTSLIFVLCCADSVLGQQPVRKRQDGGSNASPASTASSVQSTGTTASPAHQSTGTSAASSSAITSTNNASKVTSSTLSGGVVSVTTTHQTPSPTPTPKQDKLPLQPIITPAVGIAGAILLVTGFAYGIIGIKHQWLLVFFSSAYLASLAVTVLVVYVMNPPVSDAIQGAYFVAALMTGVIFGGISLVFKEVTEGLGCLLGGFCLAMWFLVLKPGGLIDSTTGKAVMIGVFAAVGWSLSFSQYTRNYGLIFCTAFSGATICVIGIDCFSRAALNDNEFPIGTHTYPITRGIRVEIAANIILFLFGLMSQLKIWKIVKERRDRKDAQRLEDEERRDQRDSRIGRKVEANNERSLAQWEAVYGDKDAAKVHVDSGVGTSVDSFKDSTNVTEREIQSIEMDDMGNTSQRASQMGHARIASDQEVLRAPELQQLDFDNQNAGNSWWADYQSNRSSKTQSKRASVSTIEDTNSNGMPIRKAPGPPVVPLPFVPPVENDEGADSENGSAESHGTPPPAVHERRGVSLNKLSLRKHDNQVPAAPLPRIDDDVASSVAATDNDNMSTKRLSVMPSPYQLDFGGGTSPFSDEFAEKPPMSSGPQTPGEMPFVEHDDEAIVRAPTAQDQREDVPDFFAKNRDSKKVKRKSDFGVVEDHGDGSDGEASVVASLKGDRLPDSISKVAMAYRTNEWAKHIADADQPDIEEEQDPQEAPVRVDVGRPEEAPRPVDTSDLMPAGEPVKSPKSPTNPYRRASATPIYSSQSQRKPSNLSLQRASSSTSMSQQKQSRNSSAPLAQQALVESPVEEALPSPYRNFTSPIPSTNNLLDERSRIVQTKPSTTSFAGLAPITTDSAALQNGPPSPMIPEENIPLSQRKSLIQQGQLSPTSPPEIHRRSSRQRTTPSPQPLARTLSSANQNGIYDSHQPRRANTVDTKRQSAMLSQWRQSLQPDNYANQPAVMAEQQRLSMIGQLQQKNYRDQKAEKARERRESQIDVAMRTGQLTNAHQNALRKMQAKANEAAK